MNRRGKDHKGSTLWYKAKLVQLYSDLILDLKGTPISTDASQPENLENVLIFRLEGFVWLSYQYLCNRSISFPFLFELPRLQPCQFALYLSEAGKDSFKTLYILLPYMLAYFMTSQTLTTRHKMTALTHVFSRLLNVDLSFILIIIIKLDHKPTEKNCFEFLLLFLLIYLFHCCRQGPTDMCFVWGFTDGVVKLGSSNCVEAVVLPMQGHPNFPRKNNSNTPQKM